MKWFLVICAILAFGAGMTFGYLGHNGLLAAGLIGFIALLVTANLDRISEFKASRSGIEARTREVVARAETAVSELQLLAIQVAELSLSLVKRQGRWGGYSDDEQDAIRNSVFSVLSKLGLPEKATQPVLREWHHVVEAVAASLTTPHQKFSLSGMPCEKVANKFPVTLRTKSIFIQTRLPHPDIEEFIRDYEYYRVNRSHRRPEVWRDRENWGHLKKT